MQNFNELSAFLDTIIVEMRNFPDVVGDIRTNVDVANEYHELSFVFDDEWSTTDVAVTLQGVRLTIADEWSGEEIYDTADSSVSALERLLSEIKETNE